MAWALVTLFSRRIPGDDLAVALHGGAKFREQLGVFTAQVIRFVGG
jgi:hypothetical protein